jgi:hypothetical protein
MNLFQVARENAEALSRRYDAARDAMGDAAGSWDRFGDSVQRDGRLGVNLRPADLLRFLALEDGVRNVYDWAAGLERRTGQPRQDLVREREKDYYERRMAFDRFLEHSERFRYGALNLGGLGVTLFGDYCLVFQEAFAAGLGGLAYLWGNSLETYLLPGCVVDEAGLRRDACPHSHRHFLAGLKHGADAASAEEERWPVLVCSRHRFIEAIFVGSPVPGDLQAVRMDRFDFDLYSSFLVDAALGRLSGSDRHVVEEFDMLLSLLEKRSVPLEKVAA